MRPLRAVTRAAVRHRAPLRAVAPPAPLREAAAQMVAALPAPQALAVLLIQAKDLDPATGDEPSKAAPRAGVHAIARLPEVREGTS